MTILKFPAVKKGKALRAQITALYYTVPFLDAALQNLKNCTDHDIVEVRECLATLMASAQELHERLLDEVENKSDT